MTAPEDPPDHADWYRRTSHCGGCGQPGNYCHCTRTHPCGCRQLHPMGSGLTADPLDLFAAAPVTTEQEGLF